MNEIDTEMVLDSYMSELKRLSLEMKFAIDPYSKEMETLSKKIDDISRPFAEKSQHIKEHIIELALQRARSYKCSSGNIQYRKGAERRIWDLDGLDKMCKIDRYIRDNIIHLKTVKTGDPVVTIKVDLTGGVSINDL